MKSRPGAEAGDGNGKRVLSPESVPQQARQAVAPSFFLYSLTLSMNMTASW